MIIKKKLGAVENFCLFVGYGRSGHTLIASLLDAHPEIVMGIEWGTLTYINLGYKRNQIFYSLIKNSEMYTKRKNNIWTGYSYKVLNSWQGKYKVLKVIGDKHGGTNSIKINLDPGLLKKIERIIGIKPKIIHVIRNPYDIITTITVRRWQMIDLSYRPETIDLLKYIDLFFSNANTMFKLKNDNYYEIIDIYHEDLINDPEKELKKLVRFFNLEADQEYLENCSRIVYSQPNKSRHNIEWPVELIQFVENELKKYPFLKHYKYSD